MADVMNQLEIQFRLSDGSDIGPILFHDTTTVAALKETVVAQWPAEKENGPKAVQDVKLISAGKILENDKTVGDCKSPVIDPSASVTTMHVIIQSPVTEEEKKTKKKQKGGLKRSKWLCLCFGRSVLTNEQDL